jgi:hypothetical protein
MSWRTISDALSAPGTDPRRWVEVFQSLIGRMATPFTDFDLDYDQEFQSLIGRMATTSARSADFQFGIGFNPS